MAAIPPIKSELKRIAVRLRPVVILSLNSYRIRIRNYHMKSYTTALIEHDWQINKLTINITNHPHLINCATIVYLIV